jgi:tripartite-type tricarboxylate transporter receptor subunit TctC
MQTMRCCALALLALPLAALGQSFPSKPIRLVLPNAAGGASDALARPVAQKLSEMYGQPVLVDNRPGAGGAIAANTVAKSPPDGHNLYLASVTHYSNTHFVKDIPYDPNKDFTPIINVASIPNLLIVNPGLPVNSVKDFIDYAKKQGRKVAFGTYAHGSMNHLAGVLLAQTVGIEVEHIAYKGGAPAIADIAAGHLQVGILAASTVLPQWKAGKVRALGLIENRRFQATGNAPTIGETLKGFALPDTWLGFLGPAGMPPGLVSQINADTRKAIHSPDLKARLESLGFEVTGNYTAEQFGAAIRADGELIRKIVTSANIKPE